MLVALILIAVAFVLLGVAFVVRELRAADYRRTHPATWADVEAARAHSVATSKGTTRGLAAEHLAPFFPEMVEQFAPATGGFSATPWTSWSSTGWASTPCSGSCSWRSRVDATPD